MADVRVKICGLTRVADAVAADAAGADYLGVVLSSGYARSVSPGEAGSIVAGTRATKVAVLVNESAEAAASRALGLGAGVIQLHGEEEASVLEELASRGPWHLWKAVRARSLDDVRSAADRYAHVAHGILVEGWREGVRGGGGARVELHPESLREAIPRHLVFVLAGGLQPDTVGEAIARFRPAVVDVSSGVEERVGEKDADLVRSFIEAARAPHVTPRGEVAS